MQETVTNNSEKKSVLSSFLDILETRDKRVQADWKLQEEKYLRRTQRIYDFHERQHREAVELRRCLDYVSQHAHVLESVLRGGGTSGGGGESVPLSAALVRQAAALQRCMAQCVANASRIRHLLTASHQPQMDTLLAKMEAELSTWTSFLQRAVDATYSSEVVMDNLHNMIAEQRRCVREVSASAVFASLCEPASAPGSPLPAPGSPPPAPGSPPPAPGSPPPAPGSPPPAPAPARSPLERRAPSNACSTPIARD